MIISEPVGICALRSASILKRFVFLPRSLRLIHVQSGPVSPSGARIAYLGEGESLPYLKERIAPEAFRLVSERVPITRLGKMIREIPESGAWLCVEINRLLQPFFPRKGLQTFPWLRQCIDLHSPQYGDRRPKIEATFGRKVRKYKYSFRLAHDAASVEHFYERLYLPYVKARFGDACYPRTLPELCRAVEKGFLLQVLRGEQWVAGVVCSVRKNEVSARAFGHLPEEEYSLRLGALSAAYYGLLRHASSHAISRVDLLRSRPDEKDGIYCHKKRWGAVAFKDCWPHTVIRLYPPEDPCVPHFLESLLFWDGSAFRKIGD